MFSQEPIPVPDPVKVRDLAEALDIEPFRLINELMDLNHFVSLNTDLDFKTALAVSSRLGFEIRKAGGT